MEKNIKNCLRIKYVYIVQVNETFEQIYYFLCQEDSRSYGIFRGMILRYQLIVILQNKLFNESSEIWKYPQLPSKLFRDAYPRYPTIMVCICDFLYKRSYLPFFWYIARLCEYCMNDYSFSCFGILIRYYYSIRYKTSTNDQFLRPL